MEQNKIRNSWKTTGLLIIIFILVLGGFTTLRSFFPLEKDAMKLSLQTDKGIIKADVSISKRIFQEEEADFEFKSESFPIRSMKFYSADENTLGNLRVSDAGLKESDKELGFAKVYSVDPTETDFDRAELRSMAVGNYLFKCVQWNFEAQECEGRWKKLQQIEPGEEYSVEITPEDPGFAEVDEIFIVDSEDFLVMSNQTIIDETKGIVEILPNQKRGSSIEKIVVNGYDKTKKAFELKLEEKLKRNVGARTFSIDPTSLAADNLTIHVKSATGRQLLKCKDWNFTKQECYGDWILLKDITPGKSYTITLTPEDPALAEVNGTFFEGFEGGFDGSYDNAGWTIFGTGTWNPDDNSAPYGGAQALSVKQTNAALSWNEINISTENYTSIRFSFYYETQGTFETGEYLGAGWWNGTAWNPVLNTSNINTYTFSSTLLGDSASDNPDFKIRVFCLNDKTNEYCIWDNITVNGTLAGDTTLPVINQINATPDPVDYGQTINFTANVTDDTAVDTVLIEINSTNYTMTQQGTSDIYYYDLFNNTLFYAGTYNYTVYANDTSNNNATPKTGNFTINELISIETTGIPINFSSVFAGDTVNASVDQGWPAYVKNTGNVDVNVSLKGYNLTGDTDDSYFIDVSQVSYDTLEAFTNNYVLTESYVMVPSIISKESNQTFYFRLLTPFGIIQQGYQGNVSFLAAKS